MNYHSEDQLISDAGMLPAVCEDCGEMFYEAPNVIQRCNRCPGQRLLCIKCDPTSLYRPEFKLREYTVVIFDSDGQVSSKGVIPALGFQDLVRHVESLTDKKWIIER